MKAFYCRNINARKQRKSHDQTPGKVTQVILNHGYVHCWCLSLCLCSAIESTRSHHSCSVAKVGLKGNSNTLIQYDLQYIVSFCVLDFTAYFCTYKKKVTYCGDGERDTVSIVHSSLIIVCMLLLDCSTIVLNTTFWISKLRPSLVQPLHFYSRAFNFTKVDH